MRGGGWLAVAVLALLAAGFAYLNRGEAATLHLGLFTFYQVAVSILVLGSFLLGMIVMFLLGLRTDLRVRRMLRQQAVSRDETELFPHSYSPPDYR